MVLKLRLEDELVLGGNSLVLVGKQLLIELLTGSEARDGHLAATVAIVLDQLLGKVIDPHRLAHVQDHDLPALGHGGGLEDEAYGLGDGHEVPDDILVGHRYRYAGLDLVHEEREHAPAASDDIAEADTDHLGHVVGKHARDLLDHALGGAHDVGWVHRLVGGDDHHPLHLVVHRTLEHVVGTADVGRDGFLGVELLKRYMLVGSGMEDQLRLELLINLVDLLHVLDVADNRDDQVAPFLLVVVEPQREVMQLRLVDVQQDQLHRVVVQQLAADFAADASAGAGYQHPLALHHPGDRLLVNIGKGTAKKVGIVEVAQIELLGPLLYLEEARDDLHVATMVLGRIHGLEHVLLVDIGNGNDEYLRLLFLQDLGKRIGGAQDSRAYDVGPLDRAVVIDEPHDMEGDVPLLELADYRGAELAGPVDHGLRQPAGMDDILTVEKTPVDHPDPHDAQESGPVHHKEEWDPDRGEGIEEGDQQKTEGEHRDKAQEAPG